MISHARVIVSDFFFSLNGLFRLSACFFYLSMYVYVFVKCKWDRCMSGFDKPTRVVYDTFKQTIIFSICIENLKYRQVDIQTNKKKHQITIVYPWVETSPPMGMDNNVEKDYFLLPDCNIWSMIMTWNSDIRCTSLIFVLYEWYVCYEFYFTTIITKKKMRNLACVVVSISCKSIIEKKVIINVFV